jgi:hypothetical protein
MPAFVLIAVVGCVPTGPYGNVFFGETDVAAVDLWTGVHAASGYLLGNRLGGRSLAPTLTALVVWEVFEPDFWPGWHESKANQAVDVLAGVGGWVVTR